MRNYYQASSKLDSFCDLIIEKTQSYNASQKKTVQKPKRIDSVFARTKDHLVVSSGTFFKKPFNIIKAFYLLKKHDLELHEYLKESLADHVQDKKNIKWDGQAHQMFLKMFSNGKCLYNVLNTMHKLGILETFIPEFKKIKRKVQHDIYHIYTVDAHSLIAVRELAKLESGNFKNGFPFLTSIMTEMTSSDRKVLYLSALLHDIGKGKKGDHSILGRKIIKDIGLRFKLSEKEISEIAFLVENHLLMPILSQRRNIDDPPRLGLEHVSANDLATEKIPF